MVLFRFTLLALLFLLLACSSEERSGDKKFNWQEISGRDEGNGDISREAIYRAKVPEKWMRQDPDVMESIFDTKKANSEFIIKDPDGDVRVVVHNFPSVTIQDRIPPVAQVSRWKRQFSILDPVSLREDPYAHGGFAGIYFEASGVIEGKRQAYIGFAMQLDNEHYQVLSQQRNNSENTLTRQKCADYTIKASGLPDSIEKYRREIQAFARSFELIEEIPVRQ